MKIYCFSYLIFINDDCNMRGEVMNSNSQSSKLHKDSFLFEDQERIMQRWISPRRSNERNINCEMGRAW